MHKYYDDFSKPSLPLSDQKGILKFKFLMDFSGGISPVKTQFFSPA